MRKLDPDSMHRSLGGAAPKRGLPPRHPAMHRTRTVDYAIIMAGEIDMLLDDSEIHLKAGDVLVQQGTNHAWVNRGRTLSDCLHPDRCQKTLIRHRRSA